MNKIEFTRFADLDYTGDEALNTLCTNPVSYTHLGLGMICAGRTMRMCVEESSTTVWM